jgi:hypothetical protein
MVLECGCVETDITAPDGEAGILNWRDFDYPLITKSPKLVVRSCDHPGKPVEVRRGSFRDSWDSAGSARRIQLIM